MQVVRTPGGGTECVHTPGEQDEHWASLPSRHPFLVPPFGENVVICPSSMSLSITGGFQSVSLTAGSPV